MSPESMTRSSTFIRTEYMALFEHGIDEGRLTMVNVSDNGNVSNICAFHLISSLSYNNIVLDFYHLIEVKDS